MPEHFSLYLVRHPANQSRETALAEAFAADRAITALGLGLVGGAYAQEGDAITRAIEFVMREDEEC